MPKPENLIPHQWKKGQSGNPKGVPKKSFRTLNDALKAKGFEELKKAQYIELLGILFNLDESEIKELASNKENPLAVRLMIQELTDPSTRSKALQDFRNYAFGTAAQSIDHTTQGEKITPPIAWVKNDGQH